MKKILIVLATAGMFVGCAHDHTTSQGSTSPDTGTVQGQGAAANDHMQNNNASGGTAYQSGITTNSNVGTGNTGASDQKVK
jgi:hypothetical protein